MIYSLFALGGVWFWVLTLVAVAALIISVEKEHGVGAVICFAVYFAAIHLFGDATLLQSAGSHWEWLIAASVLYFVIGAGWSLGKWFLWNRQKAIECMDNYCAVRQAFLRDKLGVGPTKAEITEKTAVPDDLRDNWTSYIEERHEVSGFKREDGIRIDIDFTVPRAQEHKSRITMWMSFWPASAAFTLTRDPIKNICTGIYNHLADKYQELAERAWRHAVAMRQTDITPPEVLEEDPATGPADKPDLSKRIEDTEEDTEALRPGTDEGEPETEKKGLFATIKSVVSKNSDKSDEENDDA